MKGEYRSDMEPVKIQMEPEMIQELDEEVANHTIHASRAAAIREAVGEWIVSQHEERNE